MSYFSVNILTPYKVLAKEIPAQSLHIPTTRGEINVLPDHTHLIAKLDTGILICKGPTHDQKFMVTTGIVKVLKDKVTILAQVAEREEDINIERARKAFDVAKSKINSDEILDDEQLEKFRRKLSRALVRTELASRS